MFEIGNTLREARLRRGLDISDCEAATKIRTKYLRALEEEHFEVLPGSTYVKGFLRTYAEFLELDGRLVLDEYESRFSTRPEGVFGHPDSDAARRRAKKRRNREGRVLLITSCIVMVAALGLWAGFASDSSGGGGEPAADEITAVFAPAGRRGTYIEVREGGPEGRALFTPGSVAPGQSQQVTVTPPIWVHVGDGSDLLLTVDGRTVVTPRGTTEFRVLAGGVIQPTAAG
jgi:cytoskeleton protein RodZ